MFCRFRSLKHVWMDLRSCNFQVSVRSSVVLQFSLRTFTSVRGWGVGWDAPCRLPNIRPIMRKCFLRRLEPIFQSGAQLRSFKPTGWDKQELFLNCQSCKASLEEYTNINWSPLNLCGMLSAHCTDVCRIKHLVPHQLLHTAAHV